MRALIAALLAGGLLAACGESPEPTAPVAAPVPVVAAPAIPAAELYLLNVGGNGYSADMGFKGLQARFGEVNVVLAEVPLGEGETEPGAVIHPTDPTHRAYVYFVDAKVDGAISAIYVRDPESVWRGPFDIHVGTTSLDLERINGRPFRFLGFDWDYGGYVSNWADGTLTSALLEPGRLAVRLGLAPLAEGAQRAADYPSGDAEFASDLPAVRAQPPQVEEFGVTFVP